MERYGDYISRAAQWRFVAFLCLLIAAVSISGNVIQARQVKTVPYIIEVDKLGISAVIARADVELQRKMIERLSFFMPGSAKGVLREWYEAQQSL